MSQLVKTGLVKKKELATSGAGKGAAMVRWIRSAVGAVSRWVNDKLSDTVNVRDFGAVCDGITDDTAAVNAAVLHLANAGGGRLTWPAGMTCKVLGTVWVVSNVDYDLNGATLDGGGVATGVMFETAYLNAGTLVTNVGTAYQSHVIKNAKIHGGQVTDVGKLCNFQNFNMGCKVHDLELFNARQFGVFDACFYAHFETVMHSGGTINTLPSFHFKSANNAIELNKVVTTTEWPYHFEGGSTAVTMVSCTQEGGTKGIKVTGDMLGLYIVGNYAEAIPGTWFDLSSAGTVSFDVSASYFNYVDVVLDDGGAAVSPLIIGRWAESNRIVNIGQQIGGTGPVYRGRMQVSGRLNVVEYELNNNNDASTAIPANWIVSANTNISFASTATYTSITDYRKKALVGTGLIPLRFSGDTGTVYAGTVPFCTVTNGATTTIDTQIKWQPNSLFAKFSFRAQDGNGFHELYGDIYGSLFKRHDADAMVMAISNNAGFMRISLTQTAAPFLAVTGTVQICS